MKKVEEGWRKEGKVVRFTVVLLFFAICLLEITSIHRFALFPRAPEVPPGFPQVPPGPVLRSFREIPKSLEGP